MIDIEWEPTRHRRPRRKPEHLRSKKKSSHRVHDFSLSNFKPCQTLASSVIAVLSKYADDRTSDDFTTLESFCSHCRFFEALSREEIRMVFNDAYLTSCPRGSRLFSQGDEASCSFIIVRGSVSVCLDADKPYEPSEITKVMAASKKYVAPTDKLLPSEYIVSGLGPGDAVGNQDGRERRHSYSVVSVEDTDFITIEKKDMDKTSHHHNSLRKKRVIEMLRQVPSLEHMSDEHIRRIASHAHITEYKPSQVVWRQGDEIRKIAIVLTGTLRVIQRRRLRNPAAKSKYEDQLIELSRLGPGHLWGFKALFARPSRSYLEERHKQRRCRRGSLLKLAANRILMSEQLKFRYKTTLIVPPEIEHTCEVIMIDSQEFMSLVLTDPAARARLSFALTMNEFNYSIPSKRIHSQIQQQKVETIDRRSMMSLLSPRYTARSQKSEAREHKDNLWFSARNKETAQVKMNSHVMALTVSSRRHLSHAIGAPLPDLPVWMRNAKKTGFEKEYTEGNSHLDHGPRQKERKHIVI